MRITSLYILLFFASVSLAQQTARLKGVVYDRSNRPLVGAYLQVAGTVYSSTTDNAGRYSISIKANETNRIFISYLNASETESIEAIGEGEIYTKNFVLEQAKQLGEAVVTYEKRRGEVSKIIIEPKKLERFASASGFEQLLPKIGLGVSSGGGELSSAYNVRGGNFDENLVYVNDIAVYRPFLVRSGQQEGLSIINSDMIESIEFSAGGFQAKYGDKLSSVLDIKYVKPDSFRSTVQLSFLGANAHVEGIGERNKRFSYVLGARFRSNQYLLGSLDVQGDYKPRFYDIQSMLRYNFTSKLNLSFLSALSQNRYLVVPQSRQTSFGNFNSPISLFVSFGGQELMEYTTLVNGLNLTYNVNSWTELKLIASAYNALEREHFTVEGAYRLTELDNNLGSNNFAQEKRLLGIGYFIDHARNDLQAQVYSIEHKGKSIQRKGTWEWGARLSNEIIDDRLKEWRFNDSSQYNISTTRDSSLNNRLVLDEYVRANINLNTFRVSGYLQNTAVLSRKNDLRVNYGIRSNYWTLNGENVISPRGQISFQPNKQYNDTLGQDLSFLDQHELRDSLGKRDWLLKAAAGYYYQPPFYRELRDINGVINPNLRAQRSIHFVLGGDLNFLAWNRPFKFVSEVYYKNLDRMIPYVVDNVRIRYLAENSSQGYATGLDARVNGEFINGVESWFNFSILQTQERLYYEDENGQEQLSEWLRRPTDQRVNFSILFQDELPSNESYKMNLNLVYGTSVPFYFDAVNRQNPGFTIPAYRRVDIGFSKVLLDENTGRRPSWLKGAESLWLSAEIFNLLQVNNTISYVLVKDFSNTVYGVPNYLTGRRLNLRLIAKF